jgi:hypothetical protein
MKFSKTVNLNTYFNSFFRGIQNSEREQEMKTALIQAEEFSQYLDALARSSPHRFHHVYEWGKVGDSSARLFNIKVIPTGDAVVLRYEFLPSTTPNENGQIFTDKAEVMESGKTVTFETDKAVPIGEEEFRTGPFTFIPGGKDTNGSFQEAYLQYFITRRGMPITARETATVKPSGFSSNSGYRDGRTLYDRLRIK